jgi:hypothetical protein
MTNKQEDELTMYQTVRAFLGGLGLPFMSIPAVTALDGELGTVLAPLTAEQERQGRTTTGISDDREEAKLAAAATGEVLRQFVLYGASGTTRADFKQTCARAENGDEQEFLDYLTRIETAAGARPLADWTAVGLDEGLVLELRAAVLALRNTTGAVRQTQLEVSNATLNIEAILAEAARKAKKLDGVLKMQRLSRPKLVETYFQARQVIRTATEGRRTRYRGAVAYGAPVLVYDRREAGMLTPTLSNDSGRGFDLLYYTAPTATTAPLPGQGVLVKHNEELYQADYSALGPDANAPFLLVQMTEVGPAGEYVVIG